ncbi:hypothetical protein HOLleu_37305 [Holothuria leucospilota]|uniref:Uncharacterized protein n=1 Tax=Holothuria leucospilota TaxID=206669 RepID=A0A9Q1BC91_HOLLE|nr:hypothetical protein HOLleu_37305 [Holothuria leucospilota]
MTDSLANVLACDIVRKHVFIVDFYLSIARGNPSKPINIPVVERWELFFIIQLQCEGYVMVCEQN